MAEIFRLPWQEITNLIEYVRKNCEHFEMAADQLESKIENMGEILDYLAGELNAKAERFNSIIGQHAQNLQRNVQSWKVHAILRYG